MDRDRQHIVTTRVEHSATLLRRFPLPRFVGPRVVATHIPSSANIEELESARIWRLLYTGAVATRLDAPEKKAPVGGGDAHGHPPGGMDF